jgi:hypothetical protein
MGGHLGGHISSRMFMDVALGRYRQPQTSGSKGEKEAHGSGILLLHAQNKQGWFLGAFRQHIFLINEACNALQPVVKILPGSKEPASEDHDRAGVTQWL